MDLINLKNQATIRAYFDKIIELHKTGEQYPVNLEDVWPLCYASKHKAVDVLKEHFFANIDYIVFTQKVEKLKINKLGTKPTHIYHLSASCFEHLIARKVKEVFEVYRQVFHQVAVQKPQPQLSELDIMLKSVQKLIEQDQRLHTVEDNVDEMKNQIRALQATQATRSDYLAVMGYAVLNDIPVGLQLAAIIGTKARAICKANGYPIEKIPDPRFGKVNTYPLIALKQAFEAVVN